MRRPALFLSMAVLAAVAAIATPASAQETNTRIFGKATCGAPFPCAQLSGQETGGSYITQLVGQANSCVTENFGNIASDGFFIPEMGLDYKRCLSPRAVRKAEDGPAMIPSCCVTTMGSGDMCVLACTMKLES